MPEPAPCSVQGRPAAPGLAQGPLVLLDETVAVSGPAAAPDEEAERLTRAIGAAVEDLSALMAGLDDESAGIVEFQIAMLEDEALSAPALAGIAEGQGAARVWQAVLDEQIADYTGADDEYFRARASDLTDLRDRVLRNLGGGGTTAAAVAGAILTGTDVTPTRFLEMDWSDGGGVALRKGSPTSHVAMLARARGVPMVVGLGDIDLSVHREALLDGESGALILSPDAEERRRFAEQQAAFDAERRSTQSFRDKPGLTRDGQHIDVLINVADPVELEGLDPVLCDGIGLVRTELLFHSDEGLPDEERQYAAYRRILEWAGERPVTIRTLDAGGDKPIAGLTAEGESNPFLGLRGLRLSLARPEVFRVQLRALVRAACHGRLKIMLPMVTRPEELDAARRLYREALEELRAEGVDCAEAPLGIMVEVPAVAITPERFAEADFFSIGSNDLTQYVTAAGRDIAAVAELGDTSNPAVLKLIRSCVEGARALGIEVSLCGDAGGEPALIPELLACGLRSLSVAPAALGRTKAAIAEVDLAGRAEDGSEGRYGQA